MPILDALLDLVFAPVCLGCDARIAPGDTARLVCRRCRSRLRRPPPPVCPRCGAPLLGAARTRNSFSCAECIEWPDAQRLARSACLLQDPA
ncbi:MAG: double zinc ribbon domain-containing protein, partial [Gemmatimonadota bacterium]